MGGEIHATEYETENHQDRQVAESGRRCQRGWPNMVTENKAGEDDRQGESIRSHAKSKGFSKREQLPVSRDTSRRRNRR